MCEEYSDIVDRLEDVFAGSEVVEFHGIHDFENSDYPMLTVRSVEKGPLGYAQILQPVDVEVARQLDDEELGKIRPHLEVIVTKRLRASAAPFN